MKHIRMFNESLYNNNTKVGLFIDTILAYKSSDFTNIRLRFKNWEQREGYPDRIAIDYTNNIINEEESIIIEYVDSPSYRGLRIYINGTFYKDIWIQRLSIQDIKDIFKSISDKSNNRKKHESDTTLAKKILNGVNKEIISGYFAEILELADEYNIEKRMTFKTETHWEIRMIIPGLIKTNQLSTKPDPEIVIDDKNASILESILSISKTLRESEGLSTTIKIVDSKLFINLNAVNPSTGKIIF